jgi:oxygen-independent coproporphyrinogen-3 oxidase
MARDGVVELEGSRVRITETGQPLMRTVCAVFDRYLSTGKGRHSRAV